jgi:nitrate reductase cytochrome c-type subunit
MGIGQKQRYYCKWCGIEYDDIRNLVTNNCQNNPDKSRPHKHELYEGSEKSQYFCKYCGMGYRDLRNLTRNHCQKHPPGHPGHNHEPAM